MMPASTSELRPSGTRTGGTYHTRLLARRALELHLARNFEPYAQRILRIIPKQGGNLLPFLLNEALVARIDAKADRPAGVLRVHAAFAEENAPFDTAAQLAEELKLLQQWLGLERIEITPAGDLGPVLSRQF